MNTSKNKDSQSFLLERDAPEVKPGDDASQIAYTEAGGTGLDSNLPKSLYECSTLVNGYQDKEGNVSSLGRQVDKVNKNGEISEAELPLFRKALIDLPTLKMIAENIKRGNFGS